MLKEFVKETQKKKEQNKTNEIFDAKAYQFKTKNTYRAATFECCNVFRRTICYLF